MPDNIISKVVEIDNCNKDLLIEAIFRPEFWVMINPAKSMQAEFKAPNILYTKIIDEILNIKIEMEGELVLQDKGEQEEDKGRLIELNIRNNKDIKELEGRMRIKALPNNKSKIGVFINSFKLSSDFMNLFGKSAAELTLRTKITDMLRNLEKYVKSKSLKDLL